jgi:UDP-N-acetyl-D-mannosaminuronic acid dehydrogenase
LHLCDVIIIAVATPVDTTDNPDLSALTAAIDDVLTYAAEGTLVIVESTVPPGTCAGPISSQVMTQSRLTLNDTIFLGYSPERVMPGRLLLNQLSLPRICGAEQEDVRSLLATFYTEMFGVEVDTTDTTTAEFVKTVENTYRDVQIAFANEVALRCGELGIGFSSVRRLVNKVPRRDVHEAGIGVGGHCIPKDPYLMLNGSRWSGDLIRSARRVNDRMPLIVCDLVDQWFESSRDSLRQDRSICVLGHSYLADSGDVRNSPAKVISEELFRRGYRVEIHDPYVTEFSQNLTGKLDSTSLHLLLVRHSEYSSLDVPGVIGLDSLLELLAQRD